MAKWSLGGRDLGEGGGNATGPATSWCVACLLGQWMAASPHTSISALASRLPDDGSPPPMPMGGGRSYLDMRRNLQLARWSLAKSSSRQPGGSPQSFAIDVSTTSYSHRVVTCGLPRCCLRCHDFGHLARDYKRIRSTATMKAKGGVARGDEASDPQ